MNLVKSTSLFLATIHVTNAREGGKLRGVTAVSINYVCISIIPSSISYVLTSYVFSLRL